MSRRPLPVSEQKLNNILRTMVPGGRLASESPVRRREGTLRPPRVAGGGFSGWVYRGAFGAGVAGVSYADGVWSALLDGGGLYTTATPEDFGSWVLASTVPGGSSWALASGDGVWAVQKDNAGNIYTASDPAGPWALNATGYFYANTTQYVNGTWFVCSGTQSGGSGIARVGVAAEPSGAFTTVYPFGAAVVGSVFHVGYGGGTYVAVGKLGSSGVGAAIATATDPLGPWVVRHSDAAGKRCLRVVYGNGTFVVSRDGGEYLYSNDGGVSWASGSAAAGTGSAFVFAVGGGKWLVTTDATSPTFDPDDYTRVMVTTNPVSGSWSRVGTGVSDTTYTFAGAYGGGVWVAGAADGSLSTARDPGVSVSA